MNATSAKKHPFCALLAAFALFAVVFAAFYYLKFFSLSKALSMFLTALTLTGLSVLIVFCFSSLKLKYKTYFVIALVGLVLVFILASPFVKRAKLIYSCADTPARASFYALGAAAPLLLTADRAAVLLKNETARAVSAKLQKAWPERVRQILFLAFAQLILASAAGLFIGEGIERSSHLIPVAFVAAFTDIYSVAAGATAQIIKSPVINYFLIRFPMLGYSDIPHLIGLSDFLIFTIFFHASIRFCFGTLKNTILLLLSFVITVALAIFFGVGLPVLPFMSALFVLGNIKQLHVEREEKTQLLAFMVFIIFLFWFISIYTR